MKYKEYVLDFFVYFECFHIYSLASSAKHLFFMYDSESSFSIILFYLVFFIFTSALGVLRKKKILSYNIIILLFSLFVSSVLCIEYKLDWSAIWGENMRNVILRGFFLPTISLYDLFGDMSLPLIFLSIPLDILFLLCVVALKKKNGNKKRCDEQ